MTCPGPCGQIRSITRGQLARLVTREEREGRIYAWCRPCNAARNIVVGRRDRAEDLISERIAWLQPYHRPIICTEYMARGNGSTFQGSLPIAKKYQVAAINWGLVAGKTQTYLPWDSWKHPYTDREPAVWFHEIFRTDGSPYRQEEVDLIRALTSSPPQS